MLKPHVTYRPRAEATMTWSVPKLCDAYDWPRDAPGGGTIGIVEARGGYLASDLERYFLELKQPMPAIEEVSIDETRNAPGLDDAADLEVTQDIEIAAAAYVHATGKPATIRIYWTKDIAAAIRHAAADRCATLVICWGLPEAMWGRAGADALEAAAIAATEAGVAIFAAAGDNDSSNGAAGASVDLPAAAPHVIACGGTTKHAMSETVWNEEPGSASGVGTGGGYSGLFPMPPWQLGAPTGPGRLVPDVAANADARTGYEVIFRGAEIAAAGTSAVAPLFGGLFAAFATGLPFVAPLLWSHPACFADIAAGDNGAFRAQQGPDPCTGLGVPIGRRLRALFARPLEVAVPDARLLLP
ncbi:MAG TPA: S8 family serine peptidase [Kofleriaceae bacterium]